MEREMNGKKRGRWSFALAIVLLGGFVWWGFFAPVGKAEMTYTFEQAREIIKAYGLKGKIPDSIYQYIQNGTPEQETPKSIERATYFFLNILSDSCKYAMESAAEMGIEGHVLTTSLEGESKDAGMLLASIAKEIQQYGRPFRAPCFLFAGGETTTYVDKTKPVTGHGGPGHELTAGFALVANEAPGCCMLSIDTEGSDGTTVYAGGITDSTTYRRAAQEKLILQEALRGHATFEALHRLHDCVYTGNTGTNLCDFNVLYVPQILKKEE